MTMRLCNSRILEEHLVCYQTSQRNWVIMKVLGNIVISKNFLRTHRIMVMHSNERGESCLRTLIDSKQKRYDNTVDVVVRLDDRPILVSEVWHLRDLHTFSSVTSMNSRSSRVSRESFVSTTT